MSYSYTIRARPGFLSNEVALNPMNHNSWVEVRDGNQLIDLLPMTERHARRDELQPAPETFLAEEMRTPEGLIPIERIIPDFNLLTHINPFYQIVYGIVSDAGELTMDGIYESLVKSYMVLPDNKKNVYPVVKEIVRRMHQHAFLVYYEDRKRKAYYYMKAKKMLAEDVYLVQYKRGFDPIAYQIMDFIQGFSSVEYGRLEKYMLYQIGFLRNPQDLRDYLFNLMKGKLWGARVSADPNEGNIRIRKTWVEYLHPLEPWTFVSKKKQTPYDEMIPEV